MYDYNRRSTPSMGYGRPRKRGRLLLVAGAAACAVLALVFKLDSSFSHDNEPGAQASNSVILALPSATTVADENPLPAAQPRLPFEPKTLKHADANELLAPAAQVTSTKNEEEWVKVNVEPGDNLSLIFSRHGYSKRDLHHILELGETTKSLRRIKPGQSILVRGDDRGHVLGVVQELDYLRSLHVNFVDETYTAEVIEVEPEIRVASALARIEQSLFVDGQDAGLADNTIMALTQIFGWDIDFALDVRKGDQFSVVYEEIFRDGEKLKNGKILAAEFVNRGRRLRAIYYANKDGMEGYYSDSGAAMRKAFLRTPVNFSRISSKFNLRRKHPVLNKIRAHKGVDYAAPHGTPIKATANGRVVFAGTKGGYGRTVIIKHGDSYSTLFAHMSRYARGIKAGKRVKQGQTLGFVGKTGLATGPHLHYEFRVNGVHKNPLKIKLPKAIPLENKYLADFRSKAAPLLAQLDELDDSARSDKLVATVSPRIDRNHLRTLAPASNP